MAVVADAVGHSEEEEGVPVRASGAVLGRLVVR
jgi:hypothetical protein